MNTETWKLPVQRITAGPQNHFFGYYDKSPWDISGRYILALESKFNDKPPASDDAAAICLIDLTENCRLVQLAETYAWNWQQGAMLQWLPGFSDYLIYNARRDNRFISVIYDIRRGELRTLPLPVYTLSHDGRYALSLNFARLARTRPGYGYVGSLDIWANDTAPAEDGIYWMDLTTGEYRLIITIAQIAGNQPRSEMSSCIHWFNHLLFSPDDQRFIFLHRWSPTLGGKWKTRLYTSRPDGSDIFMVSDQDMVSHFDWKDNEHILAWARRKSSLNWRNPRHIIRLLQGVGNDFYLMFKDQSHKVKIVGKGTLTSDGHCSYSPDRRWILTDTYPDYEGNRTLLLYSEKQKRRIDIGKFLSPREMIKETRCDLHPRWSRDGVKVCLDSAHEGHRQMYMIDITEVVKP